MSTGAVVYQTRVADLARQARTAGLSSKVRAIVSCEHLISEWAVRSPSSVPPDRNRFEQRWSATKLQGFLRTLGPLFWRMLVDLALGRYIAIHWIKFVEIFTYFSWQWKREDTEEGANGGPYSAP